LKTVLTYGTYDLLHTGHILLLARARQLGDHLIVGLSTDDFNHIKGKKCYYTYEERFLILSSIKYVDKIIPEASWNQKANDVVEFGVDTFVMGDDWEGQFDYLSELCKVVYLPRTPDISTTRLKEYLAGLDIEMDLLA
jgi:glycerol-3-phosphate cytidylyltransferase